MTIEENIPFKELTTFRLGGPARFLVRVHTVDDLKDAFDFAKDKSLPTLVVGGGSNILAPDEGFVGVVIKIEIEGIERDGDTVVAGAGESWDCLVAYAVKNGLWGIENLSGIPGTVGAAPVQNIGAYGAEVKDTLMWLEAFNVETQEVVRLNNTECGFGYRTSMFKQKDGWVIVRAAFNLHQNGTPNTSYRDLKDASTLSLAEIRQKVLGIRAGKFPDLTVEGTAGSFFLNPTVSAATAASLIEKYPTMPQFVVESGVKLSLAWLLDNALMLKGLHHGGARLYEKQPLVIVATKDARADDVRTLAQKVKQNVKENLNLEIEEEVRIISPTF